MDKAKGLENVKEMYEKLSYFDQYGASVIMSIMITVILFIVITYCYTMINVQPVIDDWPNQRCNPKYIPFAGFITHPEGTTATEYTAENFTYCTQNILSGVTGAAIQPLTFVTETMQNVVNNISESLDAVRGMIDKMRKSIQALGQDLMGRLMNIMVPLQQIIISFKDLMGKIQGTMTAGLFTLLGSYFTLKSLMGAIAEFIVIILIALAATIAVLWAVPFTWGFAAVNTGIFLAISIPMAIILAFMSDVMQIKGYTIPTVKCFDKYTKINMNDGTTKIIKDIIVGDILENNNFVTGKIAVKTEGSTMYKLNNVIVSDSHLVKYLENWIRVERHPNAVLVENYSEPLLYCLNTTNKTIQIHEYLFSDWDEITNTEINSIKKNSSCKINETADIHKFLDGGLTGNTIIKLKNRNIKCIKDICVGDILENNEYVYGIVEIDGKQLNNQYLYKFGNRYLEGSPNLVLCDKYINCSSTLYVDEYDADNIKKPDYNFVNPKGLSLRPTVLQIDNNNLINEIKYKKEIQKHDSLYHLLTDTSTFYIDKIKVYDYNACIDLFIDFYL